MNIGVLLSGNGVYDGSEIHEAVSTLIALDKLGAKAICMAPNIEQHHVIDHVTGDEMKEKRNVLIEAARIARGDIKPLNEVSSDDIDGLIMPGGFGAAKNLSKWAFSGPKGDIDPETKRLILEMVKSKKPIASLCVSPVVIAKALEDSGIKTKLTLGTTASPSPYDIKSFNEGVESIGATPVLCDVGDIMVDEENKIISSPCYMMVTSIAQIYDSIYKVCEKLVELAK
jgi:enhancing lycopene biosynthesis protein 2